MSRQVRQITLLSGAVLVLVGLILGFTKVTSGRISCGSAFIGSGAEELDASQSSW